MLERIPIWFMVEAMGFMVLVILEIETNRTGNPPINHAYMVQLLEKLW